MTSGHGRGKTEQQNILLKNAGKTHSKWKKNYRNSGKNRKIISTE